MPIKIQSDLPAREILDNENIFVMDEYRAMHQNIRPLQICILNLMPVKQDTELQLLRSLSNTPLQVDVTFMKMNSHLSLNTSATHLNKFYDTFDDLKSNKYDGLIITGAPVEQIPFEEVDYWKELCEIMEWSKTHVHSTFHICCFRLCHLLFHRFRLCSKGCRHRLIHADRLTGCLCDIADRISIDNLVHATFPAAGLPAYVDRRARR